MKTSYNESNAMQRSDLATDLVLCEKCGFDYIEIRLDMLADYLRGHTLTDLSLYFKEARIKPHTLNAIYLYDQFLGPEDESDRSRCLMQQFMFAVLCAEKIGAPGIVIVPSLHKSGEYCYSPERAAEDHVRILRVLCRLASDHGITLGFEIVGLSKSAVRDITLAKRIKDEVGMRNLGLVLDLYNLYLYGKETAFEQICSLKKEEILSVHINNATGQMLTQQDRCFPGCGEIDETRFLKALEQIGYDGMVSVETFRPEYWEKDPAWVVQKAYRSLCGSLRI